MIRTIIVDDEILSRIGLQSFIDGKENIMVQGVFEDPEEAIRFLEANTVDVVLTDIEMAEISGLEFIRCIRERNLASGVIIVSCHDNFAYAQQAISLGTDSYILKHSVTEENLIREIKKVYAKTGAKKKEKITFPEPLQEQSDICQDCIYRIGVLKMEEQESLTVSSRQTVEREMLVHLLEEIVSRNQMGTLFAPYNRELFILFQMKKEITKEERLTMIQNWIALLKKNIKQYITKTVICGISEEYDTLSATRKNYENASTAADQSFFQNEKTLFFYQRPKEFQVLPAFSGESFIDENWPDQFAAEMERWMKQAECQQMPAAVVKRMILQNLNQLIRQILEDYGVNEDVFLMEREAEPGTAKVMQAKTARELQSEICLYMKGFHEKVHERGNRNPLADVYSYIDHHLEDKVTLTELAETACMSVPSFCKKFKEQTGITVTQYLNEKRIGRSELMLRQQKYSLEEIAEKTGFSNVNYFLRVFKKVTGKTIGEYRKTYKKPREE